MNYIGQEIQDFSVKAYQQGELKDVTKKTFWVNGACSSFYPADFSFVCPTELEDLQTKYSQFKAAGAEIYSVS